MICCSPLSEAVGRIEVLSEIKPPITDRTPYQNRQAVPIPGEPRSETILRERR
jgi:hypothetical protein